MHRHIASWSSLMLLQMIAIFGVVMYFLFPIMTFNENPIVSHKLMAYGLTGVSLALIGAMNTLPRAHLPRPEYDLPHWSIRIFSALAKFSLFPLGMLALVVFMAGTDIAKFTPEDTPGQLNDRVLWTIDFIKWAIGFHVVALFALWSRYRTQANHIAVINNVAYYPGERYVMFPFLYYTTDFVPATIPVAVTIQVPTLDGQNATVLVSVHIALDLREAHSRNIRAFRRDNFVGYAEDWLKAELGRQANRFSQPGQFLNKLIANQLAPAQMNAQNQFPFSWDGKLNARTIRNKS